MPQLTASGSDISTSGGFPTCGGGQKFQLGRRGFDFVCQRRKVKILAVAFGLAAIQSFVKTIAQLRPIGERGI